MYCTREEWLMAASGLLSGDLLTAAGDRYASVPKHRISCGWPKGSRGANKAIGQAWPSGLSADAHREVFISPALADADTVLSTLVHELVHVLDDNKSGHKGEFARIAKAVGLAGKMTATHAGPELALRLNAIAAELGPYPHAVLSEAGRKKQGTRMLKVSCGCGFIARASGKVIEQWQVSDTNCPLCGNALSFD